MDAYVSGQCARALFIEGNDASVVDLDDIDHPIRVPIGFAFNAFSAATDVIELKGSERKFVLDRLQKEWEADRGLRMILILLDEEEFVEVKSAANDSLSELFAKAHVRTFAKSRLYACPLPKRADVETAMTVVEPSSALHHFLSALIDAQPLIYRYRDAWDSLDRSLFDGDEARARIENYLIESGTFSTLVEAKEDLRTISGIRFNCLRDLAREKNYREIISTWMKDTPKAISHAAREPMVADDESWELEPEPDESSGSSGFAVYKNVQRQQAAVVAQLRKGNVALARRFVDQLIRGQMRTGGASYAAMSLCKLAQDAKAVGLHSLQLEWAKRATDIAPEDGWAYGQTADAFIEFSRFDEALKYFELAAKFGERSFAITGRARILRAQARLDEALAAYIEAKDVLAGNKDEVYAWNGHAEVLRDMWLFDEALAIYEEALHRFPMERAVHCGRAAVLTDMGRLKEALEAYEEGLRVLGDAPVSLNGRAEVLKKMGQLEEALAACDEIIDLFPAEPTAYSQKAEILKLFGRLDAALTVYADAKARFPYKSAAYCGLAEVLREKRQFAEALDAYDAAVRSFGYEARCRIGRASVLKSAGEFGKSLAAYDEAVRLFPYNLVCLCGRADLLKELGDVDSALELYDRIIEKWPGYVSAKHAKAAILVVLGRYGEAEQLLSQERPRTRDEWIGYHVRGMMLLRKGQIDDAIGHFTRGLMEVPYARELKFYENALAVAHMSQREFSLAAKMLEHVSGPLGNVLQIHAFGAAGKGSEARSAYQRAQISCPPKLVDLRDELASRYHLRHEQLQHDERWIFREECDGMLLLAA